MAKKKWIIQSQDLVDGLEIYACDAETKVKIVALA